MSPFEEAKAAVERLSPLELAEFREWLEGYTPEWRIMPRTAETPSDEPAYPAGYPFHAPPPGAPPAGPPPSGPPPSGPLPSGGPPITDFNALQREQQQWTDPAATLKLNRITVRDPAVANIEGAGFLLPDGWQWSGGFVWIPLYSMQANLLLRFWDPQTGAAAEILPAQQFCWPQQMAGSFAPGSNWNGSIMLPPPRDAQELVHTFWLPGALAHLQPARMTSVQDLPRLAEEAARTTPGQMTIRCSRLRFTYDYQGRPWEEDVYSTLTYAPPTAWTAMWWCSGYAVRAPAGMLDRMTPQLSIPVRSLRISLEWDSMLSHVKNLHRQGLIQEQMDQARLSRLYQETRENITRANQAAWEARMASQDRQNEVLRELLGGVEARRDPHDGRLVEVPAGYARQWADEHGNILLSHNPTYDPRPGSTANWREMSGRDPLS